jgi:hypothetical protein
MEQKMKDQPNISPFQGERKLDFLAQPASGALGRDAIAIEKSDRFPVFFYRLERAYMVPGLAPKTQSRLVGAIKELVPLAVVQ